jgi:hypothetical protein
MHAYLDNIQSYIAQTPLIEVLLNFDSPWYYIQLIKYNKIGSSCI